MYPLIGQRKRCSDSADQAFPPLPYPWLPYPDCNMAGRHGRFSMCATQNSTRRRRTKDNSSFNKIGKETPGYTDDKIFSNIRAACLQVQQQQQQQQHYPATCVLAPCRTHEAGDCTSFFLGTFLNLLKKEMQLHKAIAIIKLSSLVLRARLTSKYDWIEDVHWTHEISSSTRLHRPTCVVCGSPRSNFNFGG